jgi:hypothetical protein
MYEEYMEHFTMYAWVMKCKELGLRLNAVDFDVDQINVMYEILAVNREIEQRKSNVRKT